MSGPERSMLPCQEQVRSAAGQYCQFDQCQEEKMFNNLIESSSHRQEYKRRGSFLLFTTATYVALFAITGIVSIYAYDAHLESQSTELELLTFIPPPTIEVVREVPRNTIRTSAENSSNEPSRSTRTVLVDSADNPNNPPKDVGTVASSVPPARSDSVVGPTNADPVTPPSNARSSGSGGDGTPTVRDVEPPPLPTPTPEKKILRVSRVLNSEAISLPKPNYPPLARQIHAQGLVSVQVLIDETGKVISAKAVSGHPLLVAEAQRVAMQARFSPTTINDQPVKISGVITYNFILNQ
jgi:protein TonB